MPKVHERKHSQRVPEQTARTLIAVVVVSFALTTLDSATRLLRYNIEEIGATLRLRVLRNRYLTSTMAVAGPTSPAMAGVVTASTPCGSAVSKWSTFSVLSSSHMSWGGALSLTSSVRPGSAARNSA